MKNTHVRIVSIIAAAFYASVISGKAQAFQNLDFESELGSPISGSPPIGFYNLPGWNVATVGDQYGASPGGVYYNGTVLDGTGGYVVPAGGYDVITGATIGPLDGAQSLALYVSGYEAPASISITQTGTIPGGQNSVSFLLGYFATLNLAPSQNPLNYFSLSINNQNVPLVVTSVDGQVLTVAGNISQWAGKTVTLSIANSITENQTESFGVIDDVAFSPQVVAVPEAFGMGLLTAALSLSAVFLNRRKTA
jgi:hypothetical protein